MASIELEFSIRWIAFEESSNRCAICHSAQIGCGPVGHVRLVKVAPEIKRALERQRVEMTGIVCDRCFTLGAPQLGTLLQFALELREIGDAEAQGELANRAAQIACLWSKGAQGRWPARRSTLLEALAALDQLTGPNRDPRLYELAEKLSAVLSEPEALAEEEVRSTQRPS